MNDAFHDPVPDLRSRGLVYQATHETLGRELASARFTAYAGFDPTGDSLHVGSLMPALGLARLQRAGHRPLLLMGGGTGLIGDPSGRTSERSLLTREEVDANVRAIEPQLRRLLDFDDPRCGAIVENNAEWLCEQRLVEFLRDVGKHFSVGVMLGRDSVRSRMESGISFTEFSYTLLQAFDFLHLYDRHGCRLQIGGQDQWGNITAGIDLIRRTRGGESYGLTFPLVTNADGSKFGKTEGGAVWLSAARTSPYEFHQYFMNADDRDVVRMLRWFTFLPAAEIEALAREVAEKPEGREAQRRLAREVTALVHGEAEARAAEHAAAVLFGGEVAGLRDEELARIFAEVPRAEFPEAVLEAGLDLLEAMVRCGAASSRSDARRLVQGGGVFLNNRKVEDGALRIRRGDLASASLALLRRGKRNYYLLRFTPGGGGDSGPAPESGGGRPSGG